MTTTQHPDTTTDGDEQTTTPTQTITLTAPSTNSTLTLPAERNRFTATHPGTTSNAHKYTADNGETAHVRHADTDANNGGTVTVTLHDEDGTETAQHVVEYGDSAPLTSREAEREIQAQIWDWGRHATDDRHPAQIELEDHTTVWWATPASDPEYGIHAPAPDTWYSSRRHDEHKPITIDSPVGEREQYWAPETEFELRRSTESGDWVIGEVTASFRHENPVSADDGEDDDRVYGVAIRYELRSIIPVADRDHPLNRFEWDRETVLRQSIDESMSVDEFVDAVQEVMQELVDAAGEAERMGSERNVAIREKHDALYDADAREYDQQSALSSW